MNSTPAQPAAGKATARQCVHGNPPSFCDFCLSSVDDVARVLRESSPANLSSDTCTLLARRIVAECLKPRLTNNTRAESAAVERLVTALKPVQPQLEAQQTAGCSGSDLVSLHVKVRDVKAVLAALAAVAESQKEQSS